MCPGKSRVHIPATAEFVAKKMAEDKSHVCRKLVRGSNNGLGLEGSELFNFL